MAILLDDFIINEVEINGKDPTKDKTNDTDNQEDIKEEKPDTSDQDDEFSVEDNDTTEENQNSDENNTDDEFSIDNSETPEEGDNENTNSDTDNGEEGNSDSTEDENTDDEFSVGDGDDTSDDSEDTDNNDDSSSEDNGGGTETIQNGLSDAEKEIFDNLSPEQQIIKVGELKGLYSKLYYSIDDIYNKLNSVDNIKPDAAKIVTRLSNTLDELKSYIEDYLSKTFDTKSYIENMVIYQKYLVIFNSVNKVLEKINIDINNEIDS
jgi:hypothetical protein